MESRTQCPKVHQHEEVAEGYWYFRYWHEELLPNDLVRATRQIYKIGSSKGADALTRAQAEEERDKFLNCLNVSRGKRSEFVFPNDPSEAGSILFGHLAEVWERDYVDRVVGGKSLVAASTKDKYRNHLHNHILPRWASTRIGEFRAKNILDWLQEESGSWYMMTDLRNIMSGIFTKAQDWEVLPDTYANPISRVKLPRKWQVYERRILTEEQTVRVLGRMEDPHRLISEICLGTGARISEVTGLQVKHVSIERACIKIEQRHWRGNIDSPKTERSKRTLTLGCLVERLKSWIVSREQNTPDAWVFPQYDSRKPMWDSGVRAELKEAARAEKCDFPGFGLHSLRRANITWRQEVGGSSIEASRIAGHASTKMTEEYTVVQLNRQEQLTLRIQEKLKDAANRIAGPKEEPLTIPETETSDASQNYLALNLLLSDECDRSIQEQRSNAVAKQTKKAQTKKKVKGKIAKLKEGSKQSVIVQLLKRPTGATLQDLMAATDWQAHSVRGFLSAGVGKKLGLKLSSTKPEDGERVYRVM